MAEYEYVKVQIDGVKRRLDTALELIALGRNHEAGFEISSVSGKLDFILDYVGVHEHRRPVQQLAGASSC